MREFPDSSPFAPHTTSEKPQRFSALSTILRHRAVQVGQLGVFLCCFGPGSADSAQADVLDSWYADLGIGWSYADSLDVNDASMDLDRGTNQLSFALGRRVNDDWRVELGYTEFDRSPELLYSSSSAIELDTSDADSVDASSLMLNLVRDFQVGRAWRPYVGVGVGTGSLDVRFSEREIVHLAQPSRDIIDDDDSGFAWQVLAGVTIPLTRRLELAADFRYWQMPDANLEDVSGASFDTDHTVKSAWLHLRYHGGDAGFFAAPAPRQPVERGWYVNGSLGGGYAQDEDVRDTDRVIDSFALGTTMTLGVGYHLHPRWRAELETSYWANDVKVMEFSKDIGEDSASGDVESYSLMLNVIYQFAPGSAVRPFFGLGGGWIWSSYDINTAGFCQSFVCYPEEQRARLIDDNGSALAAQAMIGVDVAISDRLTFSAAYRQLLTGTTDMEQRDGAPFNIEKRYITSVTTGFRYSLGQ